MDSRITLQVDTTFLEILKSCLRQEEKVYLLIDENGLVRIEGWIDGIYKEPYGTYIELKEGRRVDISTIIAVNGIFRPEYGEC
jgi:hypothetical protein